MKKLNFGCGTRVADGWENIDFAPFAPGVKQVNLLAGFPYPDASFDVAYSSHVLEHFSRADGRFLVGECHRVLKPGGLVRIVVPDLENTCREYLRVLDGVAASPTARRQYDWVILELLDQMVRTAPSGEIRDFERRLIDSGDRELLDYFIARTENVRHDPEPPRPLAQRLAGLSAGKVKAKLLSLYARGVVKLIPANLRRMLIDQVPPGEKHRWMYDRHGLGLLLTGVGFTDVRFLTAHESGIPGLLEDRLDVNADGQPYKNVSLYAEARKP